MRATKSRELSLSVPIRRLVIGGVVVLGAGQFALTANAQTCASTASPQAQTPKCAPCPDPPKNPVCSPYVCDTQSLTIKFKTSRNSTTGVISIGKWSLSPQSIKLKVKNPPPGIQVADAILVTFKVTFEKLEGVYTLATEAAPIRLVKGEYTINLAEFAQRLVDDIRKILPTGVLPTAECLTAKVEVTIVPLFAKVQKPFQPLVKGDQFKLCLPITITLKQVLGEL